MKRILKYLQAVVISLKNLFLGCNLKSLLMVFSPRKLLHYVNEGLFFYKNINPGKHISQKNVFEVLSARSTESIKLGNLKNFNTWLGTQYSSYKSDLINLCLLCKLLNPKKIFEIGTFQGNTALHFALNTSPESRIFTLDLPPEASGSELTTTLADDTYLKLLENKTYCLEGYPETTKIQFLFGDSASFDFSPYFNKIDLFFIDGAHSYQYVKSDTTNALKCCHPGSVIAWHDFGKAGVNGVSRYLKQLSRTYQIYSTPGGYLAFMRLST